MSRRRPNLTLQRAASVVLTDHYISHHSVHCDTELHTISSLYITLIKSIIKRQSVFVYFIELNTDMTEERKTKDRVLLS